jgi:hypothetical protein
MLLGAPRRALAKGKRALTHDDRLSPQNIVGIGLSQVGGDHMIKIAKRLDR